MDEKNSLRDEFFGFKFDVLFLEKIIYEWIRRMMYYTDFRLSNTLLQSMAIQFEMVLNWNGFFPSENWLGKFRSKYNLTQGNTRGFPIGYKEAKSIHVRDIVRELLPTWSHEKCSGPKVIREVNPINPVVEIIEISDDVKDESEIMVIEDDPPEADEPPLAGKPVVDNPDEVKQECEIMDLEDELPIAEKPTVTDPDFHVIEFTDEIKQECEVINIDDDLPNTPGIDFEDELPRSVVKRVQSTEQLVDAPTLYDFEDFLPTSVCTGAVDTTVDDDEEDGSITTSDTDPEDILLGTSIYGRTMDITNGSRIPVSVLPAIPKRTAVIKLMGHRDGRSVVPSPASKTYEIADTEPQKRVLTIMSCDCGCAKHSTPSNIGETEICRNRVLKIPKSVSVVRRLVGTNVKRGTRSSKIPNSVSVVSKTGGTQMSINQVRRLLDSRDLSTTVSTTDKEMSQTRLLKKLQNISNRQMDSPRPVTIAEVTNTKHDPNQTRSEAATSFSLRGPLQTREEALKCIKLMEDFAMMKENFRLIGFIERLEQLIRNGG